MTTILLVDDSETDRRLFGGMLSKEPDIEVAYAEHGAAALQHLHQTLPDLVLTDMQMPELDGLQLVNAIRNIYPQVPVILMTGQGSEALATKALQGGAASYVPKSQARELLIETVRHVLELSQSESHHEKLASCYAQMEFELRLDNDPMLIDTLVAQVQQLLAGMGICDASSRLQVGVALQEALLNALYHGNLELTGEQIATERKQLLESAASISVVKRRMAESPYRDRKIRVGARINRDEAKFVIRDDGPGFDVEELAEVGLTTSSESTSGRGLFLMWAFMDRVSFSSTGSTVTLLKKREAEEEAPPAATAAPDQQTERESTTSEYVLGHLVSRDSERRIPLLKPRLIVGSEPSCDVVLDAPDVSEHHCLLYLYRGWWYVKDLESGTGIRIDGALAKQRRLSSGATLSIGGERFELSYDPMELGADPDNPPPDPL